MKYKTKFLTILALLLMVVAQGAQAKVWVYVAKVYDPFKNDWVRGGVAYFLTPEMATRDSWKDLTSLEAFKEKRRLKASITVLCWEVVLV